MFRISFEYLSSIFPFFLRGNSFVFFSAETDNVERRSIESFSCCCCCCCCCYCCCIVSFFICAFDTTMIERNRFTMASAIGHCVGKRKEDDQKKNKGERKTKRKRKSSVDLHSHFFRVAIFLFLPHTGTHQMIIDTIYFGLLIRFRSKSNGDARNGRCGKRDRNSIEKKKATRRGAPRKSESEKKEEEQGPTNARTMEENKTKERRSVFGLQPKSGRNRNGSDPFLLPSSSSSSSFIFFFFVFLLHFGFRRYSFVYRRRDPINEAGDDGHRFFFLCVCLSVFLLFLCFHFVALIFLFPLPWHSPFTFFTEFFYRVFFCCCCWFIFRFFSLAGPILPSFTEFYRVLFRFSFVFVFFGVNSGLISFSTVFSLRGTMGVRLVSLLAPRSSLSLVSHLFSFLFSSLFLLFSTFKYRYWVLLGFGPVRPFFFFFFFVFLFFLFFFHFDFFFFGFRIFIASFRLLYRFFFQIISLNLISERKERRFFMASSSLLYD